MGESAGEWQGLRGFCNCGQCVCGVSAGEQRWRTNCPFGVRLDSRRRGNRTEAGEGGMEGKKRSCYSAGFFFKLSEALCRAGNRQAAVGRGFPCCPPSPLFSQGSMPKRPIPVLLPESDGSMYSYSYSYVRICGNFLGASFPICAI